MSTCLVVEGCQRRRAKRSRACSMHAERRRLHGVYGPAEPMRADNGAGSTTSAGYRILTGSAHPLAAAQGKVLVHRRVLYVKIGPGAHPCHWCGTVVVWRVGRIKADSLIADHLDEDRTNNAPENLVASCNPCNANRGRTQ